MDDEPLAHDVCIICSAIVWNIGKHLDWHDDLAAEVRRVAINAPEDYYS